MNWSERLRKAGLTRPSNKRILCAYNALIDEQVFYDEDFFRFMIPPGDDKIIIHKTNREFYRVDNPTHFFSSFFQALKQGKAAHLPVNEHMLKWLNETFVERKERIGGQAGIIANQLSILGWKSVLYTPIISEKLVALLYKKTEFPVPENDGVILKKAVKCARQGDPTKINWIFEFKEKDRFRIKNETAVAPRSNRVIFSSPFPSIPVFESAYKEKNLEDLGRKISGAVFAGYNYLKPKYDNGLTYKFYLKKEVENLEFLKRGNKNLKIHVEFVPSDFKTIEKEVLKHLTVIAESLGINEVEIVEVAEKLGFKKEAANARKNENAFTLYKAAVKVFERLKLKRLHLHNLGYNLVIVSKPCSIEREVNAVLYSSIVATSKAMIGRELKRNEWRRSIHQPVSAKGLNQLEVLAREFGLKGVERELLQKQGVVDLNDHYLLCVPTQAFEKPLSTVGLGDIVSSFAFAASL
jgi:ADP-dependent phosphofructokinase/glucokinase